MAHLYHLTIRRFILLLFKSLDIRSNQSNRRSEMLETATISNRVGSTTDQAAKRPASGDISARFAGAGAIVFAVVVIAQNLIRGASAPGNGATSTEVLAHYAD